MKFNLDIYGEYKITGEDPNDNASEFQTQVDLTYPEYLGIIKLCKVFANSFDEVKTFKGFELSPLDSDQETFKTVKEEYDGWSSEMNLLLKTDKFTDDEKDTLLSISHRMLIQNSVISEQRHSIKSSHEVYIVNFFDGFFRRGLPLTPLTGDSDEWELISTDTKKMFKNKRYSRLFKFEYPDSETPVFVDLDRFELYHTNRNAGDRFPSAIKVAIAKELAKLYPITFPYNPAIKRETVHVKVFSTKGTVFSNVDTVRIINRHQPDNCTKTDDYSVDYIGKNYKYENGHLIEISYKEYNDRKEQHKKNKHVLKKELKEAFDESGDE